MCPPPPLACRTEHRVTEVLNSVAQSISRDLDAFWAAYVRHDTNKDGHIDVSEISRFFKDLFQVGRALGVCLSLIREVLFLCRVCLEDIRLLQGPAVSGAWGAVYELCILVAFVSMMVIEKASLYTKLLTHDTTAPECCTEH